MQNMIKISLMVFVYLIIDGEKAIGQQSFAVCTKISNYPAIVAAGYDYIEVSVGDFLVPGQNDSTFLVNLEQMKQLNAKIISCTSFIPATLLIVGQEPDHDKILAWAKTTFRRAQMADIRYIVLGSGRSRRVPDGFSKEQVTQQFIDLCKRMAPLAEKYHVTVVVEPLNRAETNMINSLADGAEIVKAIDHPNIRLLCDIYHMLREDEPATEIIKYGAYIRHCHIAEKETRSAPGTTGDDFTSYFQALKQINYQGCISIEGRWDDFEQRLNPALQYMKQQFK